MNLLQCFKDDWTTPRKLFNWLDNTFNFTLDAAASKENAQPKREGE